MNKKLILDATIASPVWSQLVELMCNANDYVIDAILGQRINKIFHTIYYVSKTLIESHIDYTNTEEELLTVMYVVDKFRFCIMGMKVFVHIGHLALKYLLQKKDAQPRLIRWVLPQEYDMKISDKKDSKNVVADHLTRIVNKENKANSLSI